MVHWKKTGYCITQGVPYKNIRKAKLFSPFIIVIVESYPKLLFLQIKVQIYISTNLIVIIQALSTLAYDDRV